MRPREEVDDAAGRGWDVVDAAVEEAAVRFGARVVSTYALGSLAHGGFSPDVSDVDVALLLHERDPASDSEMAAVRRAVAARLGSPLAARLSLFWSTWPALARDLDAPSEGRFPLVDRIDLVEHGVLLGGDDRRTEVRLPSGEDRTDRLVLEGVRFMLDKLALPERDALVRSPRVLLGRGPREVTKVVLFPARFLFTLETGLASGNEAAVSHFVARRAGPAADLVRAAGAWRERGLDSGARAEALLSAGIGPLYADLVETHRAKLLSMGFTSMAARMAAWGTRLRRR